VTSLGPSSVVTALPRGRLAENVLHFVRLLRNAGLPLGPAKVLDALSAVEAVGLDNRGDFRAALASVLVSRHEHLALFDQAFDLFWRDPKLLEKMLASLLPKVQARTGERKPEPELPARLAQALLPVGPPRAQADEREIDIDAALTFSSREVLRKRDFATMTADELREVKAMLGRLVLPLPQVLVRRTVRAQRGHAVDLRATMRRMMSACSADFDT